VTPVDGDSHRHFGVYPALVTDIVDPDRLGRVEVQFPWLGPEPRAWATLCTPYSGDDQGLQIMPEVDTQVIVAFEMGVLARPYVVGTCWNGTEATPESPTRANDIRVLKTRSGSKLEFDDAAGAAKITLTTPAGHKLELDDGSQEVTLSHGGGSSIVIEASGEVRITATSTVDVSATAMNVHAPMATFDGIVQCQTLIAQVGVVSPSYTPGAGNVW
jgi:uncharacterized protein involved in type VI secretion and phage assembly